MSAEKPAGFAVCVYCSASTDDPEQLRLAARVGTEIARRGWQLVSGGGHVSMMGAVATAARAGGAHTVGVIPKHLVHREEADIQSDELIVTDTMRQRKQIMEARADAFLTLPGGIGTLEEFFEAWTGGYLGEHGKPVVLLDSDGFYTGLLAWLDLVAERGFVGRAALDRMVVATDLASAFAALDPTADAAGAARPGAEAVAAARGSEPRSGYVTDSDTSPEAGSTARGDDEEKSSGEFR